MPAKTVVLHLPLKSATGMMSPAPHTFPNGAPSPFGFTSIQTPNNFKGTTTITTTSIPTPRPRVDTEQNKENGPPGTPVTRRSSALRKKRRVKALSVGHISPTSPFGGIRPGHERSISSSSDSTVGSGDELQSALSTAGAQQKASVMTRVVNGLGFTSRSGSGSEEKREGKEHGKSLGLGLGAGILFGTSSAAGQSQNQHGSGGRSRSKSNVAVGNSRPGTAGGISGKNSLSLLDVDKPLPSRPGSREGEIRSFSRDGMTPTPFGTPGYSLLFVDHETIIPPRSNSKTRPRSISSASGIPPASRAPSTNRMRLEPILPVHVLDQMVSSPQEMSPAIVSSVVQQYSTISQTRADSPSQMTLLQRRESSRRRRGIGMQDTSNTVGDLTQSAAPGQDADAVMRARSLSRSRSVRAFSRRPSANSSLRRELRPDSPPEVGPGEYSRPGTSGSISVRRRDSSRSNRHMTSEDEEPEERRGRGRTVGKEEVSGFRVMRKEQQGRDHEQQSTESTSARDRDQDKTEKKEFAKRMVAPLARKPVPGTQVRRPSRSESASRSRSRSKSSRPISPEDKGSAGSNTMSTIAELRSTNTSNSLRTRIDAKSSSRTPSPLRETVNSSNCSNSLIPRSRSSSVDAHRLSRVGLVAEVEAPTAQQRALLATHSTTGSSSSLRARFRADEGKPPIAVSGMPKRKPVPHTSSNININNFTQPRKAMIVAIPPPAHSAVESPLQSGGAGVMSSEDEADNSNTPMTGTFFITPLLPSPPKKPVPRGSGNSSPLSTSISDDVDSSSNEHGAGKPVDTPPAVVPSVVVGDHQQTAALQQNVSTAPSLPKISVAAANEVSEETEKTTAHDEVRDGMSIIAPSTSTDQTKKTQDARRSRVPAPISTVIVPVPPRKSIPAATSEPQSSIQTPVSPVSPLSSPPAVEDCTQHIRDSAQLLELERREMIAERARWAEERKKMKSSLTTLELENGKLREMVFQLTERVERQDLELRNQQQAQRQLARMQQPPKPLTLQPAAVGIAASGKIPQHGWSVFTNPRTPPAAPTASQQVPEASQATDSKPGVFQRSYRRGSMSMYISSPTSTSSPMASPPASKQIPVLKKSSLPLLNSGTAGSKSNTSSPVTPGLTVAGEKDDNRKGRTSPIPPAVPLSKIPKLGSDKQLEAAASSIAVQAPTGRSPKALWKRTAAVAVGRKGKAVV